MELTLTLKIQKQQEKKNRFNNITFKSVMADDKVKGQMTNWESLTI